VARPVPVPPDRGGLTGAAAAARRRGWPATLAWDTLAGLSVALVLIPQSLAYAQLAGLPPERGLYAAALAPIAGALFGSSPYLQTGPTAGTALLVLGTLSAVAPAGDAEYVALAALLAVLVGAWRVLLGLLRGGPLAYLMSQPVMAGFTAASGLLIITSQLPAVFGVRPGTGNPLSVAWDVLRQPSAWQLGAIGFALFAALAMVLAKRVSPLLPGVLLAVAGAIAVAALVGYAGPKVGQLPTGLPAWSFGLPWSQAPTLLVGSLVIALVGFAEPSVIARRYAAADHQHWQPNREMVSQGLANLAAGFGGGFPVGGSFSRTALNRLAGGRTRVSGLVTGLAALAFLPMAGALSGLPTAVLAAIVIVAVVPLLTLRPVRRFWTVSRPQAVVAAVTFAITLALAPRIDRAVLIGIGLAVTVHLWRELHVQVPSWIKGQVLHLRPLGVLFFASAPPIEKTFSDLLAAHPDARRLVLHCDGLGRIDLTGALALQAVVEEARLAEIAVELVDVPPHARRILAGVLPDLVTGNNPAAGNDPTPPSR
jgi:SulP family sulfate permease